MVCTRLARRLHEPGRSARGPGLSALSRPRPPVRTARHPPALLRGLQASPSAPMGRRSPERGSPPPRLGAGAAGVCAQCRAQAGWDRLPSGLRRRARGRQVPLTSRRAAPLGRPRFGGAGTLPPALGEPPGGWRARRSHIKPAGDRTTLGERAQAASRRRRAASGVFAYIVPGYLRALCPGARSSMICPFHSRSKQKRWSPLADQTGVIRVASLSS